MHTKHYTDVLLKTFLLLSCTNKSMSTLCKPPPTPPPPSSAARWTQHLTLPYMTQMQNNGNDGVSSPSHACVKVNHSKSLFIIVRHPFYPSGLVELHNIKSAATRNEDYHLFLMLHSVADFFMMWLERLLELTLNIPPRTVTFSSSVCLCVVTRKQRKKHVVEAFTVNF